MSRTGGYIGAMARKVRPHLPGGTFHLTARLHPGVPRLSPALRTVVVELLRQQVGVSDVALFAYVVMPNHIHLVVRQGRAHLSALMQPFLRRVALLVRHATGLEGHVFERRYRDHHCAGARHVRNAIVYTHLNPDRAHLCDDAGDYPWSSRGAWLHGGLTSAGSPDALALDLAAPLFGTTLGRSAAGLHEDYRAFEEWRRGRDRLRKAGGATDPGSWPGPPRTEHGDRYWFDVLSPAAAARQGRRAQRSAAIGPRRGDLSAIARAAVAEIEPRLSAAVVRSPLGGVLYVRARHTIIRRAAAAGYRGAQIAAYLRISPSAVSKVLARRR